ncbi:MAG: bifunctional YncE family protein/alkaline phosphatase family protein [Gemmatimonadaceae bacterium]|nr:bifunctional YncE family protein/alkaline phosphatase family protein [Gemmatimonadaceae bacterium]
MTQHSLARLLQAAAVVGALAGCKAAGPEKLVEGRDAPRLPTGARLDPAGPRTNVGALPLAAVLSPDSSHILLLLNGWRQQGVQVVNRTSGAVTQTLDQPAAFIGLTFAPDGRTLYASGGNTDAIYRYDWASSRLTLRDSIIVRERPSPRSSGTSYPAGIATSRDGRLLYVAENLADSLAVIDLSTGRVTQRLGAGRYPYGVVVNNDGTVYVSSWGTQQVHVYTPDGARLRDRKPIDVARHPSTMLLNADGTRLFATSASTDAISVIDTRSNAVVSTLRDPTPANLGQGSTPIGMLLSRDGTQLYVTEGDNNAVALFTLSARTAGTGSGTRDSLLGRAPVGWYPSALLQVGDTLHVVDAKGRGTAPNPKLPQPGATGRPEDRANSYTSGQINGTITKLALAQFASPSLAALSGRVARANNWDAPSVRSGMPPITHVIYVIKENRTYDQVLSDLPAGDGDTTLLFFPRRMSPNHHALAERFGLYDRFFVNAEVSADGHNWSTAAYTTDYTQKTVPSNYSGRGRSYDYEGTNRGRVPSDDDDDDVAEPAKGYLWDLAKRKGITFRNFGEFVVPDGATGTAPEGYRGVKPFLVANTSREFPGYNLDIQDQRRADIWIKELNGWVAAGEMPQLQIVRLPNDHTHGASANKPTPQAHMADNDLALGRMVEAVSKTKFWASTAIFVLEDDAQNGPDHVDSHRSLLFVVSPWAMSEAQHRFVNTTDVIATMEALLGLDALSPYDHYGRPLREIWRSAPDVRPYVALVPSTPLTDRNPARGTGAIESRKLDLRYEDVAEEDAFNRILWHAIKGTKVPYPGPKRMSAAEVVRSW